MRRRTSCQASARRVPIVREVAVHSLVTKGTNTNLSIMGTYRFIGSDRDMFAGHPFRSQCEKSPSHLLLSRPGLGWRSQVTIRGRFAGIIEFGASA